MTKKELNKQIKELNEENIRLTKELLRYKDMYNYTRGELIEIAQYLKKSRHETINHLILDYYYREVKNINDKIIKSPSR